MKNLMAASITAMSLTLPKTSFAQQVVRVGVSPDPGAFTVFDKKSGTASGATVEVLQEIARAQGLTLRYVVVPGSGSPPGVAALNDGRIDVIAYTFQITPDRQAQYDFSDPVLSYGEALAVRRDDAAHYGTADDLKGKTVGVIVGSSYVDIASRAGAIGVAGGSLPGAVADVNDGRLVAVIGTAPTLIYTVVHGDYPNVRQVDDYQSHDVLPAGFGVKQGNVALLAKINASLDNMKSDGSLRKILAEYGL